MSLLPIVERELRVAARRKSTYRMRWLLGLAVIVLWFLLLVSSTSSNSEKGQIMFVAIGGLALAFGLLAGIFLTADCLSEEKREGTLGLLFLTDLQGYDVVFGKLIATSLHAAYGLLAIFPILALPLLMGGVTAGEFWRVALVLVATLFLSLSLGMAVSAVSQETRQAMAVTLLAIVVFAGLLPVLWWLRRWVAGNALWSGLLWPSPGFLFSRAFETCFTNKTGAHEYWASLATISAIGICSLLAASVYLPRAWHIGGDNRAEAGESRGTRWRFGSPAAGTLTGAGSSN
jgi:ABC-type transport system involved in cytochrome c biogenesis permease component